MPTVSVELRNVAGTEAALAWAGAHTIVVDRPEGHAGGRGIGFNGAQLLALTIGGCFCNHLRYVAHAIGVELGPFPSPWRLSLRAIQYWRLRNHDGRLQNAGWLERARHYREGKRSLHGDQLSGTWNPRPSANDCIGST